MTTGEDPNSLEAAAAAFAELTRSDLDLSALPPAEVYKLNGKAVARLDRRVTMLSGELQGQDRRIGELTKAQHVVMLAGPGMGKSTVLEQLAYDHAWPLLKVADFMDEGKEFDPGQPILLDEYRSEETDGSIRNLRRKLSGLSVPGWWMGCRSVDWHEDDERKLRERFPDLVVVRLLPLDQSEAIQMLQAVQSGTVEDARSFWDEAASRRAWDFLSSPLSLTLLHRLEQWPKSRYALFDNVAKKFASEPNPHRRGPKLRWGPEHLVDAAQTVCLILLLCNGSGIWDAAGSAQPERSLTIGDFGVDRGLLEQMLGTPLFDGTHLMQPMHPSLAEFLAGRALAQRVTQSQSGQPALSHRRARALLLGAKQRPPKPLRGLHAWYTAHLSQMLGTHHPDQYFVKQLIDNDPVGVLTLGDVAALSSEARRHLLQKLRQDDPQFLNDLGREEINTVCVGLLAHDDMVTELSNALLDEPGQSHLIPAVLWALRSKPVEQMRQPLRDFILNENQPLGFRVDAVDAWLEGLPDQCDRAAELFAEVNDATNPLAHITIRLRLAASMGPILSAVQFGALISEYLQCLRQLAGQDFDGDPWRALQDALVENPRPELFDEPVVSGTWRWETDLNHFMARVLAACIQKKPPGQARVLWRWIQNGISPVFQNIGDRLRGDIARWCSGEGRQLELLEAILEDRTIHHPVDVYANLTGDFPPSNVAEKLLESKPHADETGLRRLGAVVSIAGRLEHHDSITVNVRSYLEQTGGCEELLERLEQTGALESQVNSPHLPARDEYIQSQRKSRRDELMALSDELAQGERIDQLDRLAKEYLSDRNGRTTWSWPDAALQAPVMNGWKYCLDRLADVSFEDNAWSWDQWQQGEHSAIAWIAMTLEGGGEVNWTPLAAPFLALKYRDQWSPATRERLSAWAPLRMEKEPELAGEWLSNLWLRPALFLDLVGVRWFKDPSPGGVLSIALVKMLRSSQNIGAGLLKKALAYAIPNNKRPGLIESNRFIQWAKEALGDLAVDASCKQLWLCLAFGLAPSDYISQMVHEADQAANPDQLNELIDAIELGCRFKLNDEDQLVVREATLIRLLGHLVGPDDQEVVDPLYGVISRIHQAIKALTQIATRDCAEALSNLVQDDRLKAWRSTLTQALSNQSRLQSERGYKPNTVTEVRDAVEGRGALNAAHLYAVLCDALEQLSGDIRNDQSKPWTVFWNTKGDQVDRPRSENVCRDHLVDRLKDPLRYLYDVEVQVEGLHRNSTRSDFDIGVNGWKLPVEVKRDSDRRPGHNAWCAHNQLRGYRQTRSADGYGILLIFWFNEETLAHPERGRPTSAKEMKQWLEDDLPDEDRGKVEVFVLDVSRSKAGSTNELAGEVTNELRKEDVSDSSQALAYLTNFTLETVSLLAARKSKSMTDFDRQIEAARTAIEWMQEMSVDLSRTRAKSVVEIGSVADWAQTFSSPAKSTKGRKKEK